MKIGDNYTTKIGETGIISDIINLGFKVLVEVKFLGKPEKLITIKNGKEV